jgi:hypothetical protein
MKIQPHIIVIKYLLGLFWDWMKFCFTVIPFLLLSVYTFNLWVDQAPDGVLVRSQIFNFFKIQIDSGVPGFEKYINLYFRFSMILVVITAIIGYFVKITIKPKVLAILLVSYTTVLGVVSYVLGGMVTDIVVNIGLGFIYTFFIYGWFYGTSGFGKKDKQPTQTGHVIL